MTRIAPLAIFLICLLAAILADAETFVIRDFRTFEYQKENLVLNRGALETQMDADTKGPGIEYDISFDQPLPRGSQGLLLNEPGFIGKAANFLSPANTLKVPAPQTGFFTTKPDMGDFTLEFYFYLYDLAPGQVFVKKTGPVLDPGGENYLNQGFSVGLEKNRLAVRFDRFFHFRNEHLSIVMKDGDELETGRWYHAAVVFHSLSGEIKKVLDGKIEERRFATVSGADRGAVYYPAFLSENRHPLVIGEKFSGKIDELRFYRGVKEKFVVKKYPDSASFYTSKVFPIKAHSTLEQIRLGNLEGESTLDFQVRSSDEYFLADNGDIPWKSVPVGADLKAYPLGAGRFYQFQIILKNQKLENPNQLGELSLDYRVDEPPSVPKILSTKIASGAVELTWQVSTEEDLAGYKIYYVAGSTDVFAKRKCKIVNLPYDASKRTDRAEDNLMTYRLEGLENGTLYSIVVTAYDKRGPDNESAFSEVLELTPSQYAP